VDYVDNIVNNNENKLSQTEETVYKIDFFNIKLTETGQTDIVKIVEASSAFWPAKVHSI